jgi:hypothetical protein
VEGLSVARWVSRQDPSAHRVIASGSIDTNRHDGIEVVKTSVPEVQKKSTSPRLKLT